LKKHAYLIVAHEGKYQLEQLLSLLDDARNDVYLQVDSKGDLSVDDIVLKKSSLRVLPPFPIYWGGLSLIQAELNLLKAAHAEGYHYYHLLTGSDLPLVSQDRIHAFLENSNLEYVHVDPGVESFAHWKAGYYHPFVETRLFRACWGCRMFSHSLVRIQKVIGIDRARGSNIRFYHGSAFFSITHDCAGYIGAKEPWIRATFHHTLTCEEVFTQTLLLDSPFASRIADSNSVNGGNLRYIDWKRSENNSPHTFRMADYEELKKAGERYLFARKFNRTIDPVIVDAVVRNIKDNGAL
jgi:hypothetical protein